MSCSNPEHAELESELEQALDDVMRLEEELAESHKTGKSGHVATAAEIAALVREHDKVAKERDRFRDDALTQKGRVKDLEAQLEDKDVRLKELEKKRRKLEDDLDNTRKMVQTEKTRAAEAAKQLGVTEKKGRLENQGQAKLLTELQEYQELSAHLHAELNSRDATLAELHAEAQQLLEQNAHLVAQSEAHKAELHQLQHKVDEITAELAEAHDHIAVSAETEEEYERRLDSEQTRAKLQAETLTAEVQQHRKIAADAQKELAKLRGEPLLSYACMYWSAAQTSFFVAHSCHRLMHAIRRSNECCNAWTGSEWSAEAACPHARRAGSP